VKALGGHKLVNNRPIKSEKHWFKVTANQFQQPALTQEFQKPLFRRSWIRDFAPNLINYRCCNHIRRKQSEKGKLLSAHHHLNARWETGHVCLLQ
jgi:hypothetical protein